MCQVFSAIRRIATVALGALFNHVGLPIGPIGSPTSVSLPSRRHVTVRLGNSAQRG